MLHEHATSTPARLVLAGVIPAATPEQITSAFTDPERITSWWAPEATVADDGSFEYRWPQREWTLRGRILEHAPGARVRFTWSWDHEPLVATKTVLVTASATDEGTQLTITHGDYGPDDADERKGHAEGWQYFMGRLAARFD